MFYSAINMPPFNIHNIFRNKILPTTINKSFYDGSRPQIQIKIEIKIINNDLIENVTTLYKTKCSYNSSYLFIIIHDSVVFSSLKNKLFYNIYYFITGLLNTPFSYI